MMPARQPAVTPEVIEPDGFDAMVGGSDAYDPDDDSGSSEHYIPRVIFDEDDDSDVPDLSKLVIGQLRLAQGLTQEVTERKASIGQYVLANFPAADTVTLVPFDTQPIRVYKPERTKPPVCNAPTGKFGFGTPGGTCSECPLSHWTDYDPVTGKSKPPACKEGVVMRAYSCTHRTLVDYAFMSTQTKMAAFIDSQMISYGKGNFAIEMGSSDQKNNKGAWVIPSIEMLDSIPEDHVEIVERWRIAYRNYKTQQRQHARALRLPDNGVKMLSTREVPSLAAGDTDDVPF